MKKIKVIFNENLFETLLKALAWDGRERAGYLLCHSSTHGNKIKLLPNLLRIPDEGDYASRSAGHYELRKEFISTVVNEAIDLGLDIIQCHVHPPGIRGRFSGVDAAEEPKIMRHIAEKVNGIYHGSLVFSRDFKEIDGWFFDRETDSISPIQKVLVVGPKGLRLFIPHRSKPKDAKLPSFLDRTVQAYGEESVRLLRMLDFGVVGASGLGGHIIEMLARDGVGSITICDPDLIDETNLNRMPAATRSGLGRPKVNFYTWLAKRINPQTQITPYKESFYHERVQSAFALVDVVFGCVDSGARLSINRLACVNLIPYFDLGASIVIENGKPAFVGGQVYSILPEGDVCLSCSGVFDSLLSEYMAPKDRERESRQGYIQGADIPANPLVMHLDMVIAGLAYNQMLKYVWEIGGQPQFKLYYDGLKQKITAVECPKQGCLTCQLTGRAGRGDFIPFLMPMKDILDKLAIKNRDIAVFRETKNMNHQV